MNLTPSRRVLDRLTYANVVATIALFAALGTGGAYAASQLDRRSVGSKQLKKDAVTSRAVKNHGVRPKDLSHAARGGRASVRADGSLDGGSARRVSFTPPNQYAVTFKKGIASCTFTATLAPFRSDTGPVNGSATIFGKGGSEVTVATYDAAGTAVPSDFDLIVAC